MKYFLRVFGCQMNEAEGDILDLEFSKRGLKKGNSIEDSDIVIFHTCAVRKHAEDRVFNIIEENKEILKEKKFFLTGCLVTGRKKEIKNRFPFISHFLSPTEFYRILDLVDGKREDDLERDFIFVQDEGISEQPFHRYVVISHGCSNFCRYCIVPYVRGKLRSKPPEDIFRYLAYLEESGVKAITLLGQNVNQYGEDKNYEYDFVSLLEHIAKNFSFKRIGFLTSNPKAFRKDIIRVVKDYNNIERYFHIPIQSGSDRILKLMDRGYSVKDYMEIIDSIRSILGDDVAITTDVMVGFPSETKEDYEATLDVVKKIGFDDAYMFAYSERPFTYATRYMKDNVPYEEKQERLKVLIDLQHEISLRKRREKLGKIENNVLIFREGKRKGQVLGKTMQNYIVAIDGDSSLFGSFLEVKLISLSGKTFIGEVV